MTDSEELQQLAGQIELYNRRAKEKLWNDDIAEGFAYLQQAGELETHYYQKLQAYWATHLTPADSVPPPSGFGYLVFRFGPGQPEPPKNCED